MAAIAGVLTFDTPVDSGCIEGILGRMAHRAPDGVRTWSEDAIALGHGALHATPEAVFERQPVLLGDRWVVVVDGRVDNRDALIRAMELDPKAAKQLGDADLLARAWGRWGAEFWREVEGDFALAAWDRQAHALHLVRDRIGVRPLFYARTGKGLAFASEAEALLALAGVGAAPNEDRLAYYLVPGFCDEDLGATWYQNVRRVQPGECLHAGADSIVQLRRFWTVAPMPPLAFKRPEEAVEAFTEVFDEAVRCRLRSLKRPGLMLSGGIDSASVLGASRRLHAAGRADSVLPIAVLADDWKDSQETRNILAMLDDGDDYGVRLPVPSFSGVVEARELAGTVWNPAHPVDNSVLLPMLVYMAGRKSGCNVVLDGIDGDLVTLTPQNYGGRMLLAGQPGHAWREARHASRNHTYLAGNSPARILAQGVLSRLEPAWSSALRYRWRDFRRGVAGLGGLIDPEFAARLRVRDRMLSSDIRDRCNPAFRKHAGYLADVWWNPGFTRAMEGFNHLASRFGIEPRHPWCDQRVVEFFLRLPMQYKVREGWTKYVARAAYAPSLGQSVSWHSGKDHLGWMATKRVVQESAAQITTLLQDRDAVLAGRVDGAALARMRTSWARAPGADCEDYDEVMLVASLAGWLGGKSVA